MDGKREILDKDLESILREVMRQELRHYLVKYYFNGELADLAEQHSNITMLLARYFKETQTEIVSEIRQSFKDAQNTFRCRFEETATSSGELRLLIGGGTPRKESLREFRSWVSGASRVIVADPYFMHGNPKAWNWRELSSEDKKKKAEEYATEVAKVLKGIEKLDIFHLPDAPKEMKTAMRRVVFKCLKTPPRCYPTCEIHDRVWIRDGLDARIVGTSFGGIGSKLAFMLPLPKADLEAFQEELDRIRRESGGKPS